MKQTVLSFMLLLLPFLMNAAPEKNETRKLGSFDKVVASNGINVTLIPGKKEEAYIRVKNTDMEHVLTEIKGKTLKVKMKAKIYKDVAVNVYLTYKTVREVTANTGASIDTDGKIKGDRLEAKSSTGGSVDIDVEVKSLLVDAGQGSPLKVKGEATTIEGKAGAGSQIDAFQLNAKEAFVKAGTGATVKVMVTEKLEASANMGGKVVFDGNPEDKTFNTSLGGSVVKK